jgi:hypothetical protein
MTTVALCSAKGSPGVSTLACVIGAVWPGSRRVVVAECDPSGNDLAARFDLSPLIGMTSLIISGKRSSGVTWDAHVQRLRGGLEILVGPTNPDGARSLDRELGAAGETPLSLQADVVLDCGRLDPGASGQQAVIRSADHVVLLVRPDGAGIAHARAATAPMLEWEDRSPKPWFVTVGPTPFDDGDIDRAIGVPRLGSVPLEPTAAAMACGFPGRSRTLARSSLVQVARRVVARLALEGGSLTPDSPPSVIQVPTGVQAAESPPERSERTEHADVPSMVGE